jgi:hypothetical protein
VKKQALVDTSDDEDGSDFGGSENYESEDDVEVAERAPSARSRRSGIAKVSYAMDSGDEEGEEEGPLGAAAGGAGFEAGGSPR